MARIFYSTDKYDSTAIDLDSIVYIECDSDSYMLLKGGHRVSFTHKSTAECILKAFVEINKDKREKQE